MGPASRLFLASNRKIFGVMYSSLSAERSRMFRNACQLRGGKRYEAFSSFEPLGLHSLGEPIPIAQ